MSNDHNPKNGDNGAHRFARRRGRPPKNSGGQQAVANGQQTETGNKRTAVNGAAVNGGASNGAQQQPQPKRRGRPPKNSGGQQPAANSQQPTGNSQQANGGAQQAAVGGHQTAGKGRQGQNVKGKTAASSTQPRTNAKPLQTAEKPLRASRNKLRIIPLGGLNEIGKNITVYEYKDDIIVVDCGLAFPDYDMLGVDLVIPDVSYLVKNADRVRGIVITHGHEDHIGSLAYVLKQINAPVYATRLTLGIIKLRLDEHKLLGKVSLNLISAGDTLRLGDFMLEFIRVNHSIPDAVSIAINTPVGAVIHTGDFKMDMTPAGGEMIDLTRFGEYGNAGVLALMSDSTNAERPGYTISERKVGESLDAIIKRSDKQRIVIASFASNVYRIQQIIDACVRYGRHVAVSGRSMVNIINVATELGIIKVPSGTLVELDAVRRMPREKIVLITTGSQGETMSALYRMAYADHRNVEIGPGDLVIISASPIPGNEKTVTKVINELMRLGAEVIYEDFHASGHACQEEQKMLIALTKPKFFIPVHGEYKHLMKHAMLAKIMGVDVNNIIIPDIGKVIELDKNSCKITGTVQSGRILVDGLGVGDVGSVVLRDRKHLSEDGLIVVAAGINAQTGVLTSGPDIVSRGFVYVREAEKLMDEVKAIAKRSLTEAAGGRVTDWNSLRNNLRTAIADYIFEKTKRKPMILPMIMGV